MWILESKTCTRDSHYISLGRCLPRQIRLGFPDLPYVFYFDSHRPSHVAHPHFSAGRSPPLVKGLFEVLHTLRNVSSSPIACAFSLEAA